MENRRKVPDSYKLPVLILTSTFPRYVKDHSARFILDLARVLSNTRYDVTVLAPGSPRSHASEVWDSVRIFRFPYFYPYGWMKLAYGYGIHYNIRKNPVLLLQTPFFILFEFIYAFKIIKKRNIGVLHSHWLVPQGITSILLKRCTGVKIVVTVHGSDLRLTPPAVSRFLLRETDAVISPHPETSKLLTSLGFDSYHEIPNIIDEEIFNPAIDPGGLKENLGIRTRYIVSFIARLNDFRDPVTFVESLPHIIGKEKDVTFLIVGDGPLKEEVEKFILDHGIAQYVRLLGNREDVNKILRISTLIAALSPYDNIWSLVIVEAMKSGVPCIVTKSGLTGDVLRDKTDAVLIPPRDGISLANAILDMLHDEEKRRQLSENGIALMEKVGFSTPVILEKYGNIIDSLLSGI